MPHDTEAPEALSRLLSASYPASHAGIREALAQVRAAIERLGALEEEVFSAELVIAEALNNIVEHALVGISRAELSLSLAHGPEGVHVEVSDRGKPMPDGRLPIGDMPLPPADIKDLPEGGFGWFLIREIARDLSYRRVAGVNRLAFRMAICPAEPA